MTISPAHCEALTKAFCGAHPVAKDVIIRVVNTPEELYGEQGKDERFKGARGGLSPASKQDPRIWIDIYAAQIDDEDQLGRILRHEIYGHLGINTLSPEDKQALLSCIIKSENDPELSILWGMVNELYGDQSALVRAEEIFAFASEAIQPWQLAHGPAGQRVFEATCKQNLRLMSVKDLQSIGAMVASRMLEPERQIQTFPVSKHEQFDRDNVVSDGAFVGEVLSVKDGWVEQRINREGNTVNHLAQLLSSKVAPGEVADIRYRYGQGVVRGLERGRNQNGPER